MKKLFIPTFAISLLFLNLGCDMKKKAAMNTRFDESGLTTDGIKTIASSPSSYGDSAGPAAAGNEHFKPVARPVVTERDEVFIFEEPNTTVTDRQAMEDYDYEAYPSEEFESEEARLNRLQKENGIFYGYPSATGASGAPGYYDLNK
jgi:hypothetical protein